MSVGQIADDTSDLRARHGKQADSQDTHESVATNLSLRSQRRQKDRSAGYTRSFCWHSHKLSGACSSIARMWVVSVLLGGRRNTSPKRNEYNAERGGA